MGQLFLKQLILKFSSFIAATVAKLTFSSYIYISVIFIHVLMMFFLLVAAGGRAVFPAGGAAAAAEGTGRPTEGVC